MQTHHIRGSLRRTAILLTACVLATCMSAVFAAQASAAQTTNSPPAVPTELSADGAGCGTGPTRPVISSANPTLRAVVSDPDVETDLQASFAWEGWDPATNAWAALGTGVQEGLSSGATAEVTIGSGLVHMGVYRWRVQASDGTDSSAWSDWCEFEVDTVSPDMEPEVSSPVYGSDPSQIYGAVGLTADFTFSANGVLDVVGYRWGWSDPPINDVAAPALGGSVTLPLTPPALFDDPTAGGQMRLFVESVDRSGRTSPTKVYAFNIGNATPPVGAWRLDDPAGSTTLADSSPGGRSATAANVVTGTPGRILGGPTAATFNGTSSVATAPGPVVDTSTSFTVSAWVRLTAASGSSRQAVSQDGDQVSALNLGWTPGTDGLGRWQLMMAESDVAGAARPSVASAQPVQRGAWTLLTGVYDRATRQMTLYVNGVSQGTATVTAGFNATGPLVIGRGKVDGTPVEWWAGDIADVQAWNRVLSAGEIRPMAGRQVGRWRLDGNGEDATAAQRDATPTAVTWVDDMFFQPESAAGLNGRTSGLATAGPVVATDQSYTVAAWVRLDSKAASATALAQRGTRMSGLMLQYDAARDRWALAAAESDRSKAPVTRTWSNAVPRAGEWTHLAGVYDASAGQLRLYVNGELQQAVAFTAGWNAGGPLLFGYEWLNGKARNRWSGAIDDVRVYQGALTAEDIPRLR